MRSTHARARELRARSLLQLEGMDDVLDEEREGGNATDVEEEGQDAGHHLTRVGGRRLHLKLSTSNLERA